MFWKTIRGMLRHKESHGVAALNRLRVFDGCPFPYDHKKRMVVPEALKVLRMKSHRRFCSMGDLAALGGWTKQGVVARLEENRKAKSQKFHDLKEKKQAARAKAMNDASVKPFN